MWLQVTVVPKCLHLNNRSWQRFKNGITITSHHNRFSLQNRCPKLTVLDLTGTNIRKLNVEKLQVQISLLKRFCLVHLAKKGFLKRFLKVNCSFLQAGCPRLKELFLANLLLHSTPTSAEVVCNKLNVMMTNENEFNIWSNSSKEVLHHQAILIEVAWKIINKFFGCFFNNPSRAISQVVCPWHASTWHVHAPLVV